MPERELVHQSERRTTKDRNLAAGLQPTTSTQFVELLGARRVCTDSSADEGMRKASTALLEQGTQTPSPAPDLIPAVTKTSTENLHWDWYSKRGHFRVACSPSTPAFVLPYYFSPENDEEKLEGITENDVPREMAGATGLEPAASCVTGRRSNQ